MVDTLASQPKSAADLLKSAYMNSSYPGPFQGSEQEQAEGNAAYDKLGKVPFSQLWLDRLEESATLQNSAHAGIFARECFEAASKMENDELTKEIALALARYNGYEILAADFDIDFDPTKTQETSHLANLLTDIAKTLSSNKFGIKLYPHPKEISDSWMKLAHKIATENPELDISLFQEAQQFWNKAINNADQEAEEDDRWGYNLASVTSDFAEFFAIQFPKIVVGKLRKAPNKPFNRFSEATRGDIGDALAGAE